jgi:hypothetical protein
MEPKSINRENMTIEQERNFVNTCFDLYEKEGFSNVFWSPYDIGNSELCGKKFKVLSRVTENQEVLNVLPMWNIEFENGHKICAYPEEIIPSEMRHNGCSLEL